MIGTSVDVRKQEPSTLKVILTVDAMPKDIIEEIIRSSIWRTPSVADQPLIILERWRIIEVVSKGGQTQRHFVGFCPQNLEGRASTAIQIFDPATGQGVTKSGRTYQLTGKPGYDPDGAWVWSRWSKCQGFTNEREVSGEFWAAMVEAQPDLEKEQDEVLS